MSQAWKKLASFERMDSGSTWAGNTPLSDFEEAASPRCIFGLEAVNEEFQESPSRSSVGLSKPRALALQNELLAAYTSARFQKKLREIARQGKGGSKDGFQIALENLLRKPRMEILWRYGFQASEEGIEEAEMALRELEYDGDIYVNQRAIEEALFGPIEDLTHEVESSGRPATKQGVYLLLRSLFLAFSEAWFQEAILKLQHKKDARAERCREQDGYFHLPGRAELALEVHQKILPRFGFEATKEGVAEMIRHCSAFLTDHDVAHLFDAINRKLGMSPAACVRFRKCCGTFDTPVSGCAGGGACNLVRMSSI